MAIKNEHFLSVLESSTTKLFAPHKEVDHYLTANIGGRVPTLEQRMNLFMNYVLGKMEIQSSAYWGTSREGDNSKKLIDFCKSLTGKSANFRVAILRTHGSGYYSWSYEGDDHCPSWGYKRHPVQDWVDTVDGVFDLLIFCLCNPYSKNPRINNSLAVVPNHEFDGWRTHAEPRLVIPGEGQIPIDKEKISGLPGYNLLDDIVTYTPN